MKIRMCFETIAETNWVIGFLFGGANISKLLSPSPPLPQWSVGLHGHFLVSRRPGRAIRVNEAWTRGVGVPLGRPMLRKSRKGCPENSPETACGPSGAPSRSLYSVHHSDRHPSPQTSFDL